jgi:hypothetical protein
VDLFDAISDKGYWYRMDNYAGADYPGGPALKALDLECSGCVAASDLADDSVTTDKIVNQSVTAAKIKDFAVTMAKIDNKAVDSTKIADQAVGTAQIADKAVTTIKIADQAVGTGQLGGKSVTNAKLADGAVDSRVILDGAIVDADVSANAAIQASKIKDTAAVLNSNTDQNFNGSTLVVGVDHVSVNTALDTAYALKIGGKTYMGGDTTINGKLGVKQEVAMDSTLSVDGDTSIGGDLFVDGKAAIGNNMKVAGTVTVESDIKTTGGRVIFSNSKTSQYECNNWSGTSTCVTTNVQSFCALSRVRTRLSSSYCLVQPDPADTGKWQIKVYYAECKVVCF